MLAVIVVRRLFWANAINFTCLVNLQATEASLLQKNTRAGALQIMQRGIFRIKHISLSINLFVFGSCNMAYFVLNISH